MVLELLSLASIGVTVYVFKKVKPDEYKKTKEKTVKVVKAFKKGFEAGMKEKNKKE